MSTRWSSTTAGSSSRAATTRTAIPRTIEVFDPQRGTSSVVGRIEPGEDRGNSFAVSTTLLGDGSVLLTGGNGVDVERFDPTLTTEISGAWHGGGRAGRLRAGRLARARSAPATRRPVSRTGRVLIAGGTDSGTSPVLASAESSIRRRAR